MSEYFLGAPMFANQAWRGTLFTSKSKSSDFLTQYSSVFNSVEGNSTFYGLPKPETICMWREVVPDGFRFCFKFPREISHESQLSSSSAEDATHSFLEQIAPLRDRVGRLLLQLPPTFDGHRFQELASFIERLPMEWSYAVEPRHQDYFQQPNELEFLSLLRNHDVSRCLFDTQTLHAIRSDDPYVKESQRKKPQLPRRTSVTSRQPMIRFIGSDELNTTLPALRWLAEIVSNWISQGLQPFVFVHTPNDVNAVRLCRAFHELMGQLRPHTTPPLAPWPGENETVMKQQSLF